MSTFLIEVTAPVVLDRKDEASAAQPAVQTTRLDSE
jgi:hypothetical protein